MPCQRRRQHWRCRPGGIVCGMDGGGEPDASRCCINEAEHTAEGKNLPEVEEVERQGANVPSGHCQAGDSDSLERPPSPLDKVLKNSAKQELFMYANHDAGGCEHTPRERPHEGPIADEQR